MTLRRRLHGLRNNPIVIGIAFALGQSVFFSLMGLVVKLSSARHHFIDIMFWRSFICLLLIAAVLAALGKWRKLYSANMKRQISRGILGTFGMILTFAAFTLLPLSEVQSLLFAAPLFVVALSYPALKEKVGPYRTGAAIIGFLGVLLIIQPSTISSFTGGIVGLGAAFMHATIMLVLRFLGKSEDPLVTVFYFSLISTIIVIPFLPFFWTAPTLITGFYLIASGVLALLVQICLTKAYVYAPASILAPVTYLNLLWAVVFDFFIWGYVPGYAMLGGAFIIIASNFVIVIREARFAQSTMRPKL